MSSLIPERPLTISPSLATTIGLEEAVLLQVLNDCMEYGEAKQQGGYQWFSLCRDKLQKQLPFWDAGELQRISQSLKDKGIILIESAPLTQSEQFCFAMNEQLQTAVPAAEKITASHTANTAKKAPAC